MTSGSGSGDQKFIKNLVRSRLDEYPGWPTKMFKLECETYNKYQNITGSVIDDLEEEEEVNQITEQVESGRTIPFFVRPEVSTVRDKDIFSKSRKMYEFFEESGNFANLAAYVALCKIYDELNNYIDMDIFPEGGGWHHILPNANGRVPDALIRLPNEYVPVEVYNGADYLSTRNSKFNQVMDYAPSEDQDRNSYPMLINRRADDGFREEVRRNNGTVVDTDHILTSERIHSEYEEVIHLFNLDNIIHPIPHLEAAHGETISGADYDSQGNDQSSAQMLSPPSEMITDVEELPQQYLERIRGGVQLQYVNSIYRRSTDPTRQDACFVLQTIYNQLLREGGKTRTATIREGWEGAREQYRRIRNAGDRKDIILEETDILIEDLREDRIITERDGNLYARKAIHPNQSLSS